MVKMHQCKVEGCQKIEPYRTVCSMHYERYRRNGKYELLTLEEKRARRNYVPFVMPEEQECSRCEEVKPIDSFHTRKSPEGPKPYAHCKECHKIMSREANRRYNERKKAERAARRAEMGIIAPQIKNGGICVVDKCERPQGVISEGLCKLHYQRKRNGVTMDQPIVSKERSVIEGDDSVRLCTICKEVKDTSDFYRRKNGQYVSRCKSCNSVMSGVRKYVADRRIDNAFELVKDSPMGLRQWVQEFLRVHGGEVPN